MSEVIQFELNGSSTYHYGENSHLSNQISVVPYDPKNKGSKFYTYKALAGKSNKAKFFNSISEAISNYNLVIATTARKRFLQKPHKKKKYTSQYSPYQ